MYTSSTKFCNISSKLNVKIRCVVQTNSKNNFLIFHISHVSLHIFNFNLEYIWNEIWFLFFLFLRFNKRFVLSFVFRTVYLFIWLKNIWNWDFVFNIITIQKIVLLNWLILKSLFVSFYLNILNYYNNKHLDTFTKWISLTSQNVQNKKINFKII